MNKREFLKSTVLAGVGSIAMGNTVSAAVANTSAGESFDGFRPIIRLHGHAKRARHCAR
jgi:hypothetical protein